MKRTFTVNLNNTVFNIDDDAYEVLKKYQHDVEERLSLEERKEVMADIESRIAELFYEKLQKGKTVVTLEDVEAVINIMGNPNQFEDGDFDESAKSSGSDKNKRKRPRRKLYRDGENAILGGVAAGLAAYLGWEAIIIRLILIILLFLGWGTLIPIYLVMWLIVPEAKTISQKLEMQGEEVTIERIKEEAQNIKNYVESEAFKTSTASIGQRLGSIFLLLAKIFLGFIAVVVGFVGLIVIGALMLTLSLMIFEPSMVIGAFPGWEFLSPLRTALMILALLLVIGIPIFMVVFGAVRTIRKKKTKTGAFPWVMFVLWLIGVFMAIGLGAKTFFLWSQNDFDIPGVYWSDNMDDDFVDEVRTVNAFQSLKTGGALKIVLVQDIVQSVVVQGHPSALSYLVTEVDEDGVLNLYRQKVNLNPGVNRPIRVSIGTNQIETIDLAGACSLETTEKFQAENMNLILSGASSADVNLAIFQNLKLDLSGASKAELEGHSYRLDADVDGASKLDAEEFIVKNADIQASGASSVKADVSDSLKIRVSGASKFKSERKPLYLQKHVSGGSVVRVE